MAKIPKKPIPSKPAAAAPVAKPAGAHVNSETVTMWLRSMLSVMPRGAKTLASQTLGITPAALSKILNRPERAFDEKTIRLLSWVEKSKSQKYSTELFPVKTTFTIGNSMLVEEREQPGGSNFFTWRLP